MIEHRQEIASCVCAMRIHFFLFYLLSYRSCLQLEGQSLWLLDFPISLDMPLEVGSCMILPGYSYAKHGAKHKNVTYIKTSSLV